MNDPGPDVVQPGPGTARRVSKLVAAVATAALVVLVTACGGDDDAAPSDDRESFDIQGVIHGSPGADAYWANFIQGAEDAGKLLGDDVKVQGTPKFSVQKHADLVDSVIAAQPDGLLVTVPEPKAVEEPLTAAIEDGLPVMAWDTDDPRPANERIPYLRYVGVNYTHIGELAAERVLAEDNSVKRAACAIHEVGQLGLERTCEGFTRVMESAGVSVEKVEITATDPSKAAEQARGYLTNNPVDVIFTQGPPPAFPMIKVLDEERLNGKVIHITGVLTPEIIEPIKEGKVLAVVDQAPYLQGFQAVVQMDLYLRYNLLEGTDTTAEQIVDQSNIGPVEELIEGRIR